MNVYYFIIAPSFLLDIAEVVYLLLKRCLTLDRQLLHCHLTKTCCYSYHQKNNLKGYSNETVHERYLVLR